MDEIFILENIQKELERSVDQGRITEVLNALSELAALARDVAAMKKECASLRRHIEIKKSPDLEYKRKVAPLDPVWASSERKLRANLAEFQKRIAEAEDKATVLRAKIASRSSKGMPTVEAVENTIRKMLGMVEKRSGDIDVLEMHMRKLGLVGNGGTPVKVAGASEFGRTLALTDEDDRGNQEDDEKEDVIARALDLRARRRVVLSQLKEGLMKRNSEPVSSMALSKAG
jgi:nucleoporin NUP159